MIPASPRYATTWHDPADVVPDGLPPHRPTRPVHCAMFAVDIVGFSGRDDDTQQQLRAGLYGIVADACEDATLSWTVCHREDRGDAVLVIAPPVISAELLDPVAAHMWAGLRSHNKHASDIARIQLRMAVHAGYVRRDRDGASGHDLNLLFRLLEAERFKARRAECGAEFAVIASDYLYDEVIRHGRSLLEPAYQPITVTNKETHARAWVWLPGGAP
jgi:class 3 adenylate cyclase